MRVERQGKTEVAYEQARDTVIAVVAIALVGYLRRVGFSPPSPASPLCGGLKPTLRRLWINDASALTDFNDREPHYGQGVAI